ncbi:hypothetical protein C9374_002827 [Naegleria lovaniensis]|uniref:Uncharacterized protein n=1 Tax=Naegleria lovaniensis TaxID=51637 RepID=A0AA88KMD6_NAELO|nr:uncharacterized protein C9374_002827 [Naegleria lovaniensis]KAG2386381.1 hypothetical protein C9374_002827 [Naegleria lovaniensis]
MDKKRPDTNSEHCYPILQTDHLANFNQTSLAFPNIHIEYDTGMDHTDRNIEQSIPQKGLGFHCDRESNIQNNYPVLPTSLEQLKQLRCNLNEGNCVNKEKMTTTREQQKPLDAASNLCSIEHLRSKVEEKETTTPTAATCHSAEIMVKSRSISARTSTIPPEMMSHIPPISNTSTTTKPSSSKLTCSPSRPVGSSNNNLRQQRTFSNASCASSSLSSSTNTVSSSSSSSQYTSSPTSNMFTMFIAPPPQVVNTTTTTTTSTTNNHPLLMRSGTSPTNYSPSVMRMTTSRLSTRNNCKFFEYKPGNGNKLQKTPATLESPQTMGVTMNKIEKQKKMKIMMSVPQTQTATTNVNLIQQHVVPHHSSTSGCKMDALLSGSRSSVNNILNNTSFQLPSMTTEETLLSSPTTTSVSSNNMITTQLPPISTLATPKTFRTAISINDILN